MSVNAKKKYIVEDIESKPKSKRQPGRAKKTKAKKTPFEVELKDEEVFAIDLVHPPTKVIHIFKKDAKFVQVKIIGMAKIAQTLDFYAEEWSYLDTAVNPNGTCWIIMKKVEEE